MNFAEKRRKFKRKGVYASLFGVGAPEALVIGVVALLVFGPKGLAEVSFFTLSLRYIYALQFLSDAYVTFAASRVNDCLKYTLNDI